MNPKVKAKFEARATLVKALAHPTRLFLVDELSRGERCVCDLAKMAGIDISTTSKHLSILKQAGILQDRKQGLQVFYNLRMGCVLNFFQCVESAMAAKARQQMELMK